MKTYIADTELIAEWDWTKNANEGLDPHRLSHGSTKRAFWICPKGHAYASRIDHRYIMGSGCPYCAGKLPIVGENDLATCFPALITEWDYEKNGEMRPEQFLAKSNKQVWWKCLQCGKSWQTSIASRTDKETGCPDCARVVRGKKKVKNLVAKKGTFWEKYPEIAKEWNYEKNGELTPWMVMPGSNQYIWWKCSDCGYEWQTPAYSRTGQGTGCPKCTNRVIIAGDNDFATRYPELATEWNPEKNGALKPQDVAPKSNKKVWWRCSVCGHDWEASVSDRASGRGCPKCAIQKRVQGRTDTFIEKNGSLKQNYPQLAKQLHPTKNMELTAENISPYSSKKVWWLCQNGHAWKAAVYSRVNGNGCPICAKEHGTSFPEQALYFYLSKCLKAQNRAKIFGKEVDIFLPDLNIGVEYNGRYYHRDRKDKDAEKVAFLRTKGIRMICIVEGEDEKTENDTIYYRYTDGHYKDFETVVEKVFICMNQPVPDIDIERDRMDIFSLYISANKENSIAEVYPSLVKEWNYQRNGELTPGQVSYGSKKRVWWICPTCKYEWEAVVHSRKRASCPRCAGRVVTEGLNDLQTINPTLSEQWDFEKNDLLPTQVMANSHKTVWWKCINGHSWMAQIKSRNQGCGCPVCYKESFRK